LFV
jgi:hypothetical protein